MRLWVSDQVSCSAIGECEYSCWNNQEIQCSTQLLTVCFYLLTNEAQEERQHYTAFTHEEGKDEPLGVGLGVLFSHC